MSTLTPPGPIPTQVLEQLETYHLRPQNQTTKAPNLSSAAHIEHPPIEPLSHPSTPVKAQTSKPPTIIAAPRKRRSDASDIFRAQHESETPDESPSHHKHVSNRASGDETDVCMVSSSKTLEVASKTSGEELVDGAVLPRLLNDVATRASRVGSDPPSSKPGLDPIGPARSRRRSGRARGYRPSENVPYTAAVGEQKMTEQLRVDAHYENRIREERDGRNKELRARRFLEEGARVTVCERSSTPGEGGYLVDGDGDGMVLTRIFDGCTE